MPGMNGMFFGQAEGLTESAIYFTFPLIMKCAFAARQILFVFCFWLVIPAKAVSPEFMAAYQELLGELSSDFPGKETGSYDKIIVEGFTGLLKLGTREELGDAVAATLADTRKRSFWADSSSLSAMLGPQFDRSKIVAAIRGNLENYFVLDEVKNLGRNRRVAISIAATQLCYYGTEDDVELVKSFAAKVAKINPGLAASLEMTVYDRAKVRELRAKAASANSAGILEQQPREKGPSLTKQTPPPAQNTPPESKPPTDPIEEPASTAWSFIVVLIVVALGLLWLVLKKRK